MIISANDLKVKGVTLLDTLLNTLDEVLISVRGKNKYVVVDMERYEYLRECELEQAYRDTLKDIENGNSETMTVKQHLENIENALRD